MDGCLALAEIFLAGATRLAARHGFARGRIVQARYQVHDARTSLADFARRALMPHDGRAA